MTELRKNSTARSIETTLGNFAYSMGITAMIVLTFPEIAAESTRREINMVNKHGARALGFATLSYLAEIYQKPPDEKSLTPSQQRHDRKKLDAEWRRIFNSPTFHRLPSDDMTG